MSNRRRPVLMNMYRSEFLHSGTWYARRDRWFAHEANLGKPLTCSACGRPADKKHPELHHLNYLGLRSTEGNWQAGEAHEDLVPLHAYCHELLHRLIDRDTVLSRHRNRRTATQMALERLRHKLQPDEEPRS